MSNVTRVFRNNATIPNTLFSGIHGKRETVAKAIKVICKEHKIMPKTIYVGGHHVAIIFDGGFEVAITSDNADWK